jgi:hypothetical protein
MKFEKSWLEQSGFKLTLAAALWTTACGGLAFSGSGNGGAGNTGTAGSGAGGAVAGAGGSDAGGSDAGGSDAGGSDAGGSEAAGAGGHVCNVSCPACEGVSVIKAGECCPTCEPAGGSGGVSSGGSGPVCTGACSAIGCGPGFKSVTEPGACCPTCVPDGAGGAGGAGGCTGAFACPGVVCAKGFMSQQQAGSCCPTCVPSDTCSKGQQGYAALRQKLLAQPEVGACKVSKDCTLLAGSANCGDSCSHTPVSAALAQSIDDELSAYASNNCSTCTPIYPPCAYPVPPSCVQGVCVLGSNLAN